MINPDDRVRNHKMELSSYNIKSPLICYRNRIYNEIHSKYPDLKLIFLGSEIDIFNWRIFKDEFDILNYEIQCRESVYKDILATCENIMNTTVSCDEKINKLEFDRGEWDNEPDFLEWEDDKTKYKCQIIRDSYTGTRSGNIILPVNHYFTQSFKNLDDSKICSYYGDFSDPYKLPYPSDSKTWDAERLLPFFPEDIDSFDPLYMIVLPDGRKTICGSFYYDTSLDITPRNIKTVHEEEPSYKNIEYVKSKCKEFANNLYFIDKTYKEEDLQINESIKS